MARCVYAAALLSAIGGLLVPSRAVARLSWSRPGRIGYAINDVLAFGSSGEFALRVVNYDRSDRPIRLVVGQAHGDGHFTQRAALPMQIGDHNPRVCLATRRSRSTRVAIWRSRGRGDRTRPRMTAPP